jgi:hypothetical protein
MIVDAFLFYDEFDLLNLRLEELYDVVDLFIPVESDLTHRGKPKPYFLSENMDKINPKFRDKLTVYKHVCSNRDPNSNPWPREYEHRNFILEAIKNLDDDDRILMSDCDEIPSVDYIKSSLKHDVTVSMQRFFYYNFDQHKKNRCHGTISVRKKLLSRYTPQQLRDARFNLPQIEGGWHLSYFGNAENVLKKIVSISHYEFDTKENTNLETINNRINSGEDIFGRNNDFEKLVTNTDFKDLPTSYLADPNKHLGIFK